MHNPIPFVLFLLLFLPSTLSVKRGATEEDDRIPLLRQETDESFYSTSGQATLTTNKKSPTVKEPSVPEINTFKSYRAAKDAKRQSERATKDAKEQEERAAKDAQKQEEQKEARKAEEEAARQIRIDGLERMVKMHFESRKVSTQRSRFTVSDQADSEWHIFRMHSRQAEAMALLRNDEEVLASIRDDEEILALLRDDEGVLALLKDDKNFDGIALEERIRRREEGAKQKFEEYTDLIDASYTNNKPLRTVLLQNFENRVVDLNNRIVDLNNRFEALNKATKVKKNSGRFNIPFLGISSPEKSNPKKPATPKDLVHYFQAQKCQFEARNKELSNGGTEEIPKLYEEELQWMLKVFDGETSLQRLSDLASMHSVEMVEQALEFMMFDRGAKSG